MLDQAAEGKQMVLAISPEVSASPVLTACKCKKPSICIMDYDMHSPSPRGHWMPPEPRINRVCTRCWAHWFGPPQSVRFFTSKEWDQYLETAQV